MTKTLNFVDYLEKGLTVSFLKPNYPLAKLTSLRVGGNAKAVVEINSLADLKLIFQVISEYKLPCFFLGRGTNILASDLGFAGLIVSLGQPFKSVTLKGNKVLAGAGATLSKVLQLAAQNGLDGLAFAAGIPGTVGGAVCGNAGAFEHSMAEVVSKVTVFQDGKLEVLTNSDLNFAYRSSSLSSEQILILEVELSLKIATPEEVKAKMQACLQKRKATQPHEKKTAGSIFKNPHGLFAGQLIEACGGKSWQIGGAKVSAKHANFFINTGRARATDFYQLILKAQKEVYDRFKVKLEPEVRFLGDFSCAKQLT